MPILFCSGRQLGSFSNDHSDGGDKSLSKMNLYFTFECRKSAKSVQYAYRSKNFLRLSMHRQRSILKEDTKNIIHWGSRSPKYVKLGHFTLLFCRGRQTNVPKFKRTCRTIVLLIKPFVCDVLVAVAGVVCKNSLTVDPARLSLGPCQKSRNMQRVYLLSIPQRPRFVQALSIYCK